MTPPPESSDELQSRASGSAPSPIDEHSFVEAAFNALPTQVAILDEIGDIVYTNDAWRQFGESNGLAEPAHTIGVNYLEVCDRSGDEHASTAAAGIRAVLEGTQSEFSFEYPCHSDAEQRWFTMRAIRFAYEGATFVLVLHLTITDRKRSELRVQEQNTELETLNRVNSIIRDVIDSLLSGVTRTEIETAVCEKLAASSLFHSAYLVERALDSGGVTVRASAGFSDTASSAIESLEGDELADSGLDTAIDDEEVIALNRLLEADPLPDSLADVARRHGYESHLVVPVRYRRTTYGALVVNAAGADAFSERERSAFAVLGDAIGYAYNAIENRLILHADTVTELVFEVPRDESVLATISSQADCTAALDGVVPAADEKLRCYVTIEGASPDAVLGRLEDLEGIAAAHVVNDHEDGFLLECLVRTGSPLIPLVEYGSTIESAQARSGSLELSVIAGTESDVRSLVDAVRSAHPNTTLRSKRQTERPIQSVREFRTELDERLTDRQRDVLEAAYFAGYFERPRKSTGGEIADSFDISSPTFHQHLQTGLNKLTGLALDQQRPERPHRDD
jgi:HTH-type transcriptional regulator, bacterioopsin transcriptional activator and related proteins